VLFGFLRKGNETECTSDTIKKLEGLLHLHALDTVDLIHEYYLERLRDQTGLQEAAEGVLTVKLIFINDVLKVDVLNANNIKAMDSNGTYNGRSRHVSALQRYAVPPTFIHFDSARECSLKTDGSIIFVFGN